MEKIGSKYSVMLFCLTNFLAVTQILLSRFATGAPLLAFAALDILRGREPYTAAEMGKLEEMSQPGVTFPNLTSVPETFSFTCQQVNQPGYYADVEFGCMVYHRCERDLPLYTYLCPAAKLFNQITLNCDFWYNVQCQMSKQFYDYSNPRLYLGPNVTFLDSDNSLKNLVVSHSSTSNQVTLGQNFQIPSQFLLSSDKSSSDLLAKKQLNQGFRLTIGSKGRHRFNNNVRAATPIPIATPPQFTFPQPTQLPSVTNNGWDNSMNQNQAPSQLAFQPTQLPSVTNSDWETGHQNQVMSSGISANQNSPPAVMPTQAGIGSPLGFWQSQNNLQQQASAAQIFNTNSPSVNLPSRFFQQSSFRAPIEATQQPTFNTFAFPQTGNDWQQSQSVDEKNQLSEPETFAWPGDLTTTPPTAFVAASQLSNQNQIDGIENYSWSEERTTTPPNSFSSILQPQNHNLQNVQTGWWNQRSNTSPQQLTSSLANDQTQADVPMYFSSENTSPVETPTNADYNNANALQNDSFTSYNQLNFKDQVSTTTPNNSQQSSFGNWLAPSNVYYSTKSPNTMLTSTPVTAYPITPMYDGFFDDNMPEKSESKSSFSRLQFANSEGAS